MLLVDNVRVVGEQSPGALISAHQGKKKFLRGGNVKKKGDPLPPYRPSNRLSSKNHRRQGKQKSPDEG